MGELGVIKPKRISVFDVAKAIGIIIVVYAHINATPELLTFFYAFHMPLFFVISGLFFNKSKYTFKQFLLNRFLTLICPYLFFYTCMLIFNVCVDIVSNGLSMQVIYENQEVFLQMFIAQDSSKVICAPLWFIPCLFVVELLYFFIAKLKTVWNIIVCTVLVVLGWLLETQFTMVAPYLIWSIDSALFAIGFYAIGNLTATYVKKLVELIVNHKLKYLIGLGIFIVSFACMTPLAFLNGKISLGSKILNNGALIYATGLLGTAGIIGLSILFEKAKFLVWVGRNTFCIMAVHYFLYYKIKIIVDKVIAYDEKNILQTLVVSIICFGVSLICVVVYNFLKKLLFNKKKKEKNN